MQRERKIIIIRFQQTKKKKKKKEMYYRDKFFLFFSNKIKGIKFINEKRKRKEEKVSRGESRFPNFQVYFSIFSLNSMPSSTSHHLSLLNHRPSVLQFDTFRSLICSSSGFFLFYLD